MDCLCLAPASLDLRPRAAADQPRRAFAVAVMLVFAGAAALACARRMLYKPGGDPGGAYARVREFDGGRRRSIFTRKPS